MSDDALIFGAAAPEGHRWIRSTTTLDAGWVIVASLALILSSFFALIDLPAVTLRTGADPLRFYVVGLPVIAVAIAIMGAVRRSVPVVAAATGALAPGVALTGSLGASLLLSDDAAFADVGVAISVGASMLGAVMLVRWFVYHPMPLLGDQSRPVPFVGALLIGLGALLAGVLLVTTIAGDFAWSLASVGQTSLLSTVACVVVAAGVSRTVGAAWLCGAACAAQVVAVLVVRAESTELPWDSDMLLRTGIAGLVVLVAATGASVAAVTTARPDPAPDPEDDTTESWRWSADD